MNLSGKRRIIYLALQATREGQASHAHVHEIIAGLNERGWNVELFEPWYSRKEHEVADVWRALAFIGVQLRLAFRLMRGVDAIYMRNHFGALPTSLLARVLGIPVIQEVNGPYADLFISRAWTRVFRSLVIGSRRVQLRWANAIVAVTPQLGDWAIAQTHPEAVIEVIPNGANHLMFNPRATTTVERPERYVLFFGALAAWQGLDVLLDALDLPAWPDGLPLVIVGDGAGREMVQRKSHTDSRLVYLGQVRYREMPGIVAGAALTISAQGNPEGRSDTGLSPLKVFESLACGVPVIVTDYPGQADLIRSYECGIVVPPGDAEALAQSVGYLYEHPEERQLMGQRGRAAIETEHSWSCRSAATDALLRRVVSRAQ